MKHKRSKLPADSYAPSTSRQHERTDEIHLDVLSDQESVQMQHDLPQEIIREMPSRTREMLLVPNQNGTLRGPKDKKEAYKTLRRRNLNPSVYNELGESWLVDVLENDPAIEDMQVEEVEQLQSDTLRDLHVSLTAKRKVMSKLKTQNEIRKQKKVGCCKQLKYSMSMQWEHFKLSLKDAIHNLQLWKKSIRTIEGNFGSGVASYFRFLRWQLGLNIFYFCIILLFAILPQLLSDLSDATHYQHLNCSDRKENFSIEEIVQYNLNKSDSAFRGPELLTGAASFEYSVLYYGNYAHTKFSLYNDTIFDSPVGYLLANALGLLLILIINAIVLAKSHIKNYTDYQGFGSNFYSNKVFAGWDFAITSEKTAALQFRRLYLDLKEHLVGVNVKLGDNNIDSKCKVVSECLGFNLFSLILLGGTGALLYFLLYYNSLKNDMEYLREMSVSLTVSAITIIIPLVFTFLSHYEKYASRQSQLKITMARALLLIGVVLGILVYFYLRPAEKNDNDQCWETSLGMEIYRLMIVDFLVWNILYMLLCWIKKIVHNNEGQCIGTLEFEVSWHTWHLIYNQALCWVGTYFVPFMPLILSIKLCFTFYIKKECVLRFCQPPTRVWKANVAETIFLGTTFVGLILSTAAFGYIITEPNSRFCGPFVEFDSPLKIISCVTQSIQNDIGEVAVLIIKPGTVLFIIVFLCSLTYYARATANAHLKMMNLLRKQVATEGKDKTYLLYMFETALKKYKEQHQTLTRNAAAENIVQGTVPESETVQLHELGTPSTSQYSYGPESSRSQVTPYGTPNKSQHDSRYALGSHDSMSQLTNLQRSPIDGRENTGYWDDSPRRESASDNRMYLMPSVSHQPPFQNIRKGSRDNEHIKKH